MESNQSPRAFVYLLLLLGFIAFFFILDRGFGLEYNAHEINEAAREHARELNKQKEEAKKKSEGYTEEGEDPSEGMSKDESEPANNSEAETDETTQEVSQVDSNYFGQLMAQYKNDIVQTLENGKARTDVIVRYYRHAPDGNSAYALEKLGYYIHERPVDPRYADFQSNAIYYGDSVSLEDIQIVGYTLMNEGLPIKIIKSSKFGDTWKARSIEIGTDTTLVNQPTLDLAVLQNFVK